MYTIGLKIENHNPFKANNAANRNLTEFLELKNKLESAGAAVVKLGFNLGQS